MSDVSPWAQFGALGLVTVTLFGMVFRMLASHREERETLSVEHRSERKEWQSSAKEQHAEMKAVVEKLTEAIRDNSRHNQ